jgi:hypothetical protein
VKVESEGDRPHSARCEKREILEEMIDDDGERDVLLNIGNREGRQTFKLGSSLSMSLWNLPSLSLSLSLVIWCLH